MSGSRPRAGLRDFADPACWDVTAVDRDLFDSRLSDFVPPDAFDAHAHWYDLQHLLSPEELGPDGLERSAVGFDVSQSSMRRWMGELTPRCGLYFGFPIRTVDCAAENALVASEVRSHPGCAGLMLIRPGDDPAVVERTLVESGFSGFKVYHVFAERTDSFQCEQSEFLPTWAWEIAHRRNLWITMHMVLPRALSDPRNLHHIQQQCRQWPGARLVLAHAARGFNAAHTIDAVDELRGIDNIYFDTSAVCEPAAFEAIIQATGTTRLMYGSDFPVSEVRGKALSVGDGFLWLYQHNVDWDGWPHGSPTLVGIESLLALRQACRTMKLVDRDIERIFSTNARDLLNLRTATRTEDLVQTQYRHAKEVIPGGTQLLSKRPEMFAPDHWPAYYEQAIGCEVIDTSGRRFMDMSYNGILSCILGFADPDVNAAVIRRVQLGSMATQQTYDEVRLADLLIELHPWSQMARFTRSGGEAAAVAVRIARAATGRDKVAICGYHGWHDWYLAANLGDDDSLSGHLLPGLQPAGVPRALRGTALTFRYNRLDELDALLAQHGRDLAAVIMEPARHTEPEPGFLEGVRERASACGAALIFDEISIGWRLGCGGAHRRYGVDPDLAIFAKATSNGFPLGAVIGRREFMTAAEGSFISSTYWTEGVGPAAAVATVEKMRRIDVPGHLARIGSRLKTGWLELGRQSGVATTAGGRPDSVLLGFEHPDNVALLTLFIRRMLEHGILAASGFNPTLAHSEHHVDRYLAAARIVLAEIAEAVNRGDVLTRIDNKPKHTMFARLTN